MPKSAAAAVAATTASAAPGDRSNALRELVCLALALSLVALAFRIATIW